MSPPNPATRWRTSFERDDIEPDEYDDEYALRNDIAAAEAESGGGWQ